MSFEGGSGLPPEIPEVPLGQLIVFEAADTATVVTGLGAPDVSLGQLVVFQAADTATVVTGLGAPDVSLGQLVVFQAADTATVVTGLGAPDVSLGQLVVFDAADTAMVMTGPGAPDVSLGQLVIFTAPDVRLEALAYFDSALGEPKGLVREWAESLIMVAVFILVFTGYVAQATQVPTPSMVPTIMVGDHFFIEKLAFPGNYPAAIRPYLPKRAIHRGDIIVFKPPLNNGDIPFVKRVIGLPGETVEVREKDVFINGVKLNEPYKVHLLPAASYRSNFEAKNIPADNYYVMGDNRDNSLDSRYWGTVAREAIMGMPLFVYWSYENDKEMTTAPTMRERLNEYFSVATHFFSRTRWFRFGTLVR